MTLRGVHAHRTIIYIDEMNQKKHIESSKSHNRRKKNVPGVGGKINSFRYFEMIANKKNYQCELNVIGELCARISNE